MNPAARTLLLLGAFVLLVFGIVCLKQRLGPEPIPPAFIPADGAAAGHFAERGGSQPTILSAEPSQLHDLDASRPLREFRPVPLEDASQPADYPINTTSPTYPREDGLLPATERSNSPLSGNEDPIDAAAEVPLPTPAEFVPARIGENAIGVEPTNGPPESVITVSADSLWTISERVYGQGVFYKALFLLNRARVPHPDRITAGILIETPPVAELRRLYPEACPKADPLAGADG